MTTTLKVIASDGHRLVVQTTLFESRRWFWMIFREADVIRAQLEASEYDAVTRGVDALEKITDAKCVTFLG